jgi:hypothetical protein
MVNPSRYFVYALLPLLFLGGLAAFPRAALADVTYTVFDQCTGGGTFNTFFGNHSPPKYSSGTSFSTVGIAEIGQITSIVGGTEVHGVNTFSGGSPCSAPFAGSSGSLGGDLQTIMAGQPDGSYYVLDFNYGGYLFFVITGGVVTVTGEFAIDPGNDTKILSVDPADGATIATSSLPYEFVTIGNIKASDWKDGIRLRIKLDRNTDQQSTSALVGFDSAFGNYTYFDIPVESGAFVISTTTLNTLLPADRVGLYHMTQDIQVPGIGVHWWIINFDLTYTTLDSTTTAFTIGTTTDLDNIAIAQTNYLNSIATSTNGSALSDCQFSWFNSAIDFSLGSKLFRCLAGVTTFMFVPSPNSVQATFDQVRGGILTRAPWGYATRLVTILSSNATTTLPTFTANIYTTGTSTPDTTLTFDPGDMLDGGAALLNSVKANGTSLSLRDIVEPWIQLFIALSIVFIIAIDVLHIRKR